MPARYPPQVVVIGASLAGLFGAAALARTGAAVTILERDVLPADPVARPGVPQGRQAHVLLHRGHLAAEALLPGLTEDLVAAGAVRFDSGHIPWLGEYGWQPTVSSYELLSLSRPLLEHLVRRRVLASGISLTDGVRVSGLARDGSRWRVTWETAHAAADVVIDAAGRGSRLPHWLAGLGCRVEEPEVVEAQLGYACRLYRARNAVPVRTAVVVAATPATGIGGLAIPLEEDRWLLCLAGYGARRPSRSVSAFERLLAELRDPVLRGLAARLEPEGDVAVHRQTANRRHRYGAHPDWPGGLLAVGDSLCAFDPVYGQGITVAACQAELLAAASPGGLGPHQTRRLQRRLSAVADLPWSVATNSDLRHPSCTTSPDRRQCASIAWSERLGRLAAGGDRRALRAFAEVYHLMASPALLFSPALLAAVARAELRGYPEAGPRPSSLSALDPVASATT